MRQNSQKANLALSHGTMVSDHAAKFGSNRSNADKIDDPVNITGPLLQCFWAGSNVRMAYTKDQYCVGIVRVNPIPIKLLQIRSYIARYGIYGIKCE